MRSSQQQSKFFFFSLLRYTIFIASILIRFYHFCQCLWVAQRREEEDQQKNRCKMLLLNLMRRENWFLPYWCMRCVRCAFPPPINPIRLMSLERHRIWVKAEENCEPEKSGTAAAAAYTQTHRRYKWFIDDFRDFCCRRKCKRFRLFLHRSEWMWNMYLVWCPSCSMMRCWNVDRKHAILSCVTTFRFHSISGD